MTKSEMCTALYCKMYPEDRLRRYGSIPQADRDWYIEMCGELYKCKPDIIVFNEDDILKRDVRICGIKSYEKVITKT